MGAYIPIYKNGQSSLGFDSEVYAFVYVFHLYELAKRNIFHYH